MNRLRQPSFPRLAVDTTEIHSKYNDRQSLTHSARLIRQSRHNDPVSDTVALILAGGRGTRLLPLTQRRCKPAVPFGGSFRIIDFTLSNCVNSGIRRVGVLTQYEQHSLIRHLQEAWNFLRRDHDEFIDVLPAQQRHGDNWYQGTADAITQNCDLLSQLSPAYTLILAGDHIYKADYRRMIQQHVKDNADVTVACCEVPTKDAGQYGIVECDRHNRIIQFEEKPASASSMHGRPGVVQASMGLYLFKTELLLDRLSKDSRNLDSSHDFGTDIIPDLIKSHRVSAYDFEQAQNEDYWRDVGTLDAYYEANMQLLAPEPSMELSNRDWPIHTRAQSAVPAHFATDSTGHRGLATDCIVGSGCVLRGSRVRHSVLFSDVQIHAQSQIDNSLILPNAIIGAGCRIRNAIIDSQTHIADGTEIGYDPVNDALHYRLSENGIVVVTADSNWGTMPSSLSSVDTHAHSPATLVE